MSRPKIVLFITASHRPVNTPNVFNNNFSLREVEYFRAFKFYAKFGLPIVFIDNTDYLPDKLKSVASHLNEIEFFHFPTSLSYLGKGHGEKEIFDYAFTHSLILKDSDYIIKISGRYIVKNLLKLIDGIIYGDADVYINWGRNLKLSDTRIMIFKKNFYQFYFKPFLEKYLNEPNGQIFERVFARSAHKLISDGGIVNLWPTYPHYKGQSGSTGALINFSIFRRLKYQMYFSLKRWIYYQIV
jgi:hypothetical protein